MKETKKKRFPMGIFKPSKYIDYEYRKDKIGIVSHYNNIGLRDANIVKDSVYMMNIETKNGKTKKAIFVDIEVEEGNQYYFGTIELWGNTQYSDPVLKQILGIKKGDEYNEELLQSRISFDQNGRDLSTLTSKRVPHLQINISASVIAN